MSKIILSLLCLTFGASVFADQCAVNDRSTSQTARAIMVQHSFLYYYCEPCGDTGPTEIFVSNDKVDTKDKKAIHFSKYDTSKGAWLFTVNQGTAQEKTIDLAYTYVFMPDKDKTIGQGNLINVGSIVNCGAEGISPVVTWDASKIICGKDGCG